MLSLGNESELCTGFLLTRVQPLPPDDHKTGLTVGQMANALQFVYLDYLDLTYQKLPNEKPGAGQPRRKV